MCTPQVSQASMREISLKHHVVVTTDTTGSPRALSVLSRCQVKYGERCDVFFYGDSNLDFLDHIHYQTESLLASCRLGNIGFVMHFPLVFDIDQLERDMEVRLGPRWNFGEPEKWLSVRVKW